MAAQPAQGLETLNTDVIEKRNRLDVGARSPIYGVCMTRIIGESPLWGLNTIKGSELRRELSDVAIDAGLRAYIVVSYSSI